MRAWSSPLCQLSYQHLSLLSSLCLHFVFRVYSLFLFLSLLHPLFTCSFPLPPASADPHSLRTFITIHPLASHILSPILFSRYSCSALSLLSTQSACPMRRSGSHQGRHAQSAARTSLPHSRANLLPLILIATSVILSAITTTASAQTPQSTCCMSYASLDEKTLYIQGGFTTVGTNRTQVDQFAALDLTVPSWPTSSPPWMLPPYRGKAPNSSWHSMVVSKDHANLFFWDPFNSGWSAFNIADRTWTNTSLPLDATRTIAIRSGVDYNTGYVYVPAGTSNGTQMAMNTISSTAYTTSAMPTELMPVPINHETFVWSSVRGTFLHYGGKTFTRDTANPYLNEYSATNGWSRVVSFLSLLLLSCMGKSIQEQQKRRGANLSPTPSFLTAHIRSFPW